MTDTTQSQPAGQPQPSWPQVPLRRSTTDRLLGGVAAGLAQHFDIDVAVVRLAFVLLTVLGGFGVPLYAASWLLIPEEGANQSVLSELMSSARPA
jgi:phage shock protein PspC (stress-responsive transcriptional regulator)